MKRIYWFALPLLAASACAPHHDLARTPAPMLGAPMVAGTVNIWRGVKVLANTTNIDWSNASFGVSGQPTPTLSFFNAIGAGQQCWLRVTVNAPSVPVLPGQGGAVTLTIPAVPVGPAPSPWAATFDNNPPGHWSITKATITGGAVASNAVAGTWAGAVFKASAQAGQVAVVDGTVAGCQI